MHEGNCHSVDIVTRVYWVHHFSPSVEEREQNRSTQAEFDTIRTNVELATHQVLFKPANEETLAYINAKLAAWLTPWHSKVEYGNPPGMAFCVFVGRKEVLDLSDFLRRVTEIKNLPLPLPETSSNQPN